jgi:hypothetical protein
MRERRSATLPLPVLPAGLGLAGLGEGSGDAALAFLACGESRGLGRRAAGGGRRTLGGQCCRGDHLPH